MLFSFALRRRPIDRSMSTSGRRGSALAAAVLTMTSLVVVAPSAASAAEPTDVPADCVDVNTAGPYDTSQDCVVPAGVSSISFLVLGGGGGGGLGVAGTGGGGGGAGQFYGCFEVPVTAGDTITMTIGAGGTGGTSLAAATAGAGTSVTTGAGPTTLCNAAGGAAGALDGGSAGGAIAGSLPSNGGLASGAAGGGGGGDFGSGYNADGTNAGSGGIGVEMGFAGGGGGGSVGGTAGVGSEGGGDGSADSTCSGTANASQPGSGGGGGSFTCPGGAGAGGFVVLQFTVAQPCVDGSTGYEYDISATGPLACLVPDGKTSVDILVVGGGGGGGYGSPLPDAPGAGGGGGEVVVCTGVSVTAGETLGLSPGSGGWGGTFDSIGSNIVAATAGGETVVSRGATSLCTALGGQPGSGATGDTAVGGASGSGNAGGDPYEALGSIQGGGGGGGATDVGADSADACGGAGGPGQTVSDLASPGLFADLDAVYGGGGGGASTSECDGALGGEGGGGAGQPAATWGDQAGSAPGGGGGGGSDYFCAPDSGPCGFGGSGYGGYIELRFTGGAPDCSNAADYTTTTADGWTYVAFTSTSSCVWTPDPGTMVDYLAVGGGASGSVPHGGGGGAGGVRSGSFVVGTGGITVDVGAGGAGRVKTLTGNSPGLAGQDTLLTFRSSCATTPATITAIGGGPANVGGDTNGGNGGSGGGTLGASGSYTPGAGAPLQGNHGGNGSLPNPYASGGGGGAGSPATDGSATGGGNGGDGRQWLPGTFDATIAGNLGLGALVSGSNVYFGGGGGGGATGGYRRPDSQGGLGGLGGGGNGGAGGNTATSTDVTGTDGIAGSGGGGGGGGLVDNGGGTDSGVSNSGSGGSGIVILRFKSGDTRTPVCVVPNPRWIPVGTSPVPDPSTYVFQYTDTSVNHSPITPTITGTEPLCASAYVTPDAAGVTHEIYCEGGSDPVYLFDTSSVSTATVGDPPAADCVNAVGYTTVGDDSCTVPAGVTSLDILLVGGGGGGGWGDSDSGGGGGGGEVVVCTISVTPGDVISYTVGSGGAGGDGSDVDGSPLVNGVPGGDSTASTCVAAGGLGGTGSESPYIDVSPTGAGIGGASGNGNGGGLYGQIHEYVDVETEYYVESGGGGGGAGGVGADASDCVAGDGGEGQVVNELALPGLFSDVTDAFGGGGGGGVCFFCEGTNTAAAGTGVAGGGDGGGNGAPGTDNSGGGGGGGGWQEFDGAGSGGDGGTGYVEIRFDAPLTIPTTISTQVSDTSIDEAETLSDVATISTATVPCAAASATDCIAPASGGVSPKGLSDPTGTVQWYYCYDSTTAPTSCDDKTGTAIGDPISVVDDTPDDGTVTATLEDWLPADGPGFYLFHAVYSGDESYDGSFDDGTNESFEVIALEHLHVCIEKLYVVYGASDYTPKVYYCVPEPPCPTVTSGGANSPTVDPLSDDCDEDDYPTEPVSDGTEGYSTVSDGRVVDSGQVSDLPAPTAVDGETITDTPIQPQHYEHGIPEGWRKVNPSEYPDTTPPTCDSEYEQGDGVAMSPMPITCDGGDDGPYLFDYEFVDEMYIHPAVLSVRPTHLRLSYGDPEPSPYGYTIKGFKLHETATVLGSLPTCDSDYTPTSDAGSRFYITCSGGVAANYTFKYERSHVHVDRLRIPAHTLDRVVKYGDAAPVYTWSLTGSVEATQFLGLPLSQLKGYVAPVCGATYTPTTSAGVYAIDCAGGGSTNYEFVTERGTLTVQKATLKVAPSAATAVYGGSSPTAGVTVTGFLNGQTVSTAAGYRAPKCTAAGFTATTNAGTTLPITCTGGSATNYTFEQVGSALLTVTKAAATVTADAKSVVYGSAAPSFTATLSGLKNGQTAATVTGLVTPVCTSTYVSTSAVGSASVINCSGASSTNYTFTYVAGKVTVTKAILTVTPNNLSITKGSAIPAYTYTVTGFQNGQTATTTGTYTAPKCTSPYSTKSAVGNYTINCSGGSAANYSFVYKAGTLSVK